MNMNKLLVILISCLSLVAISCGNDDDPKMPTNALALNMTIGDRNTTIGGSDVYINSSLNFTTSNSGIADLGKKGGFNKNPNLTQIAQEVAVTPGYFYQIISGRTIRTVAGERAYPIYDNYYNVYVDSWIYDKDKNISGAKINYTECVPKIKQLPEWDSIIELTLKPKPEDKNVEVAEYTFPKGCEIDDNMEVSDFDYSDMKDRIDIDLKGNRISFSNSSWTPGAKIRVILLVRYESVYTRVLLNVASSKGYE